MLKYNIITYLKAKFKSNGVKASPCFRTFWIRNFRKSLEYIFSILGDIRSPVGVSNIRAQDFHSAK
jgi:hypothetical protein